MSLDFTNSTGDLVSLGSPAALDDMWEMTFWCWYWKDSGTTTSWAGLYTKVATGSFIRYFSQLSSNQQQFVWHLDRVDTQLDIRTNNVAVEDEWNFVAFNFSESGASSDIYIGSLTANAVVASYASKIVGLGSPLDDSALDALIGNWDTDTPARAANGLIAVCGIHNVSLPLEQIVDLQRRPRALDSSVQFCWLGFAGTGTQPDWSGTGTSGTVTGATVGSNVGLGPPFGFDEGWQGLTAPAATPGRNHRLLAGGPPNRRELDVRTLIAQDYRRKSYLWLPEETKRELHL